MFEIFQVKYLGLILANLRSSIIVRNSLISSSVNWPRNLISILFGPGSTINSNFHLLNGVMPDQERSYFELLLF